MASSINPVPPLQNVLLASLSRNLTERLVPHLSTLRLTQGTLLYEDGDDVDDVYFPHDGMLSLLTVMKDGKAVETATVGREGVVGAMAGFGLQRSMVRVVVQLPMTASKIAVSKFRTLIEASDELRGICVRYNEVLLGQARIAAACNVLHPIQARFCRWLLQAADRAASETIPLTQEFVAELLGVRRTSVTEVARKVQEAGAIKYTRGVIHILDVERLRKQSCECYRTLVDQSEELS